MSIVICPECSAENSSNAVNCSNCRIILKLALEQATKQESIETSQGTKGKERIKKTWWIKYLVLAALSLIGYVNLSTDPQTGDEFMFIGGVLVLGFLFILFIFIDVLGSIVRWIDNRKKAP